jgi:hypothetical protein
MKRVSAPGVPSIDWLPVLVQTRSITACKCIAKHARSPSPISLDHGLQVSLLTRSITASKFPRSWPPSASTHSLDHCLQVHLQTRSITDSNCISNLAPSWRPGASPNSLNHGLQCASPNSHDHGPGVYPYVHSLVIFRRTSNCSQAPPAASSDIPCIDG